MNFERFIARRVAASGQQSFSRLILRIAVVAVALSVAVMICSNALIAGFKKEISTKIFGFWGHIHITDTDINRSLLERLSHQQGAAVLPCPGQYPPPGIHAGGGMAGAPGYAS